MSELMDEISAKKEQILKTYKTLHSIPELGFKEYKTTEYLRNRLENAGIEISSIPGMETGLVATIRGTEDGPVMGLRADIDGLPILEDTDLPFASEHKGVMHACGHDANATMLLETLEFLVSKGISKGTLKAVFQPNEECGEGALGVIGSGVLADVQELVGIHLRPANEAALGQATAALMHGSSCVITAEVSGKSAHGGRPHKGINVADVAAAIVSSINALRVDPAVQHSVKTTKIVTNSKAPNIIPDKAELAFDLRAQTNELMDELRDMVPVVIKKTAEVYGADVEIIVREGMPAASYDSDVTKLVESAIKEVLGDVLPPIVSPGGEDFHFYSCKGLIKTGFVGLGADLNPGLHHQQMTFDLKALVYGVQILTTIVTKRLN